MQAVSAGYNATQTVFFGKKKRVERDPDLSPLLYNSPLAPASDAFVRKVNKGIQSLPEILLQAWINTPGSKVGVGKFLTDMHPDLKDITPRGWDEWKTWDHCDGISAREKLSISEYRWERKSEGKPPASVFDATVSHSAYRSRKVTPEVTKGNDYLLETVAPEPLFRHEAGHVFDAVLAKKLLAKDDVDLISESLGFEEAYMKDLAEFSDKDMKTWYYHVQPRFNGEPTLAGYSEAFAEAFASLYGGGCDRVKPFQKQFENTVAFVREAVRQFEEKYTSQPRPVVVAQGILRRAQAWWKAA